MNLSQKNVFIKNVLSRKSSWELVEIRVLCLVWGLILQQTFMVTSLWSKQLIGRMTHAKNPKVCSSEDLSFTVLFYKKQINLQDRKNNFSQFLRETTVPNG